jgi:hypothetical protein
MPSPALLILNPYAPTGAGSFNVTGSFRGGVTGIIATLHKSDGTLQSQTTTNTGTGPNFTMSFTGIPVANGYLVTVIGSGQTSSGSNIAVFDSVGPVNVRQ